MSYSPLQEEWEAQTWRCAVLGQRVYGKEAGDADVGRADCAGAVAALYRVC